MVGADTRLNAAALQQLYRLMIHFGRSRPGHTAQHEIDVPLYALLEIYPPSSQDSDIFIRLKRSNLNLNGAHNE